MYITFDEYLSNGGSVTNKVAFARLEAQARSRLNYRTMDRIRRPLPEWVLPLMVELIELENKKSGAENNIQSMSNDGVSVSFAAMTTEEYNRKFEDLICSFAGKYAYRGVGYV